MAGYGGDDASVNATSERDGEGPYNGQQPGPYWHAHLEAAKKVFDKWQERGKKVIRRYRDERDAIELQRRKFNILWSNTQVMFPSLYGRMPKPEVSRRYEDADPVGRAASTMLERCLEFEVEHYTDFDAAMRGVVEDRLLPGRGTAWVRYEPTIVPVGAMGEPDTEPHDTPANEVAAEGAQLTDDVEEQVTTARSPCDYVHWLDFLHSPARTWEEVWWVARRVYMTCDEGVERFGDVFRSVPIDSEPLDRETVRGRGKPPQGNIDKKAEVWEIWNKRNNTVCWVAKGYPQALDERPDPLQLEGFFPCPKPLFATVTTGSLIPVPDYCEYEDQALEMDSLTQRISLLVKACKVVGVFNAEYKEVQRMLNEGFDNKLIPVTAWASLAEKGGLTGAIQLLDLKTILEALRQLYESREAAKQVVYEVYGLGDIIRGATNPNETLGAQQLKANFGNLRLRSSQGDVARFASDLFRLKAQIITKFYPDAVIVEMSGMANTADGQDQQVVAQALQLLRSSTVRDFRISVEADTLAQIDEQSEREQAMQMTQAVGVYMKDAVPLLQAAPEFGPMVAELLMFNVRKFHVGRSVEAAMEKSIKLMEQRMSQPPAPPPPDPMAEANKVKAQATMVKAQSDMQIAPIRAQGEQVKAQAGVITAQTDLQRAQVEASQPTVIQMPGRGA